MPIKNEHIQDECFTQVANRVYEFNATDQGRFQVMERLNDEWLELYMMGEVVTRTNDWREVLDYILVESNKTVIYHEDMLAKHQRELKTAMKNQESVILALDKLEEEDESN